MKKTDEDRLFAARFAAALQVHVDRELGLGKSMMKIGEGLGVTGWGLQKQLNGGTPSIRTIALAYAKYGVSVPYDGIAISKALTRKRKATRNSERQLFLPFQIMAPSAGNDVTLKLLPTGVRKYQLRLSVRLG
jgi:hypothetical protein